MASSTMTDTSSQGAYELCHVIQKEVTVRIDTAYTFEELRSTTFELTTLRPLRELLGRLAAPCMQYALFVNRIHFQQESSKEIATALLCLTRANVCELLAIRLTSNYDSPSQSFRLLQLLTISFNVLDANGSAFRETLSETQMQTLKNHGTDNASTALELAVISEAKNFLATPIVQRIVDMIYTGKVSYLPRSRRSVIEDSYKLRGAEIYNVRSRPVLDHNRLRVPRIRAVLETLNFVMCVLLNVLETQAISLLALFVGFQGSQTHGRLNSWEILFNIFTLGFCLDEFVQLSNSGGVYFADIWNALDATWLLIYVSYFVLRLYALAKDSENLSIMAFNILAMGSIILLPRLVGTILKDNVVILGIQSMFADFANFMLFATISASGFFLALLILNEKHYSAGHIFWLMLRVWLGSAYLAFDEAADYHPIFGPIIMTVFAVFANFLLLTIVISILTDTFARVQRQATAELLYQKAVKTLERLQGDALLEYTVPGNLIALLIVGPASLILTPRHLHRVHVLTVRITAFPILFAIAIQERWQDSMANRSVRLSDNSTCFSTHRSQHNSLFEYGSGVSETIAELFDHLPNPEALQKYIGHERENLDKQKTQKPHVGAEQRRISDVFFRSTKSQSPNLTEVNQRLDKLDTALQEIQILLRGVLGDTTQAADQPIGSSPT